MTVPPNPSFSVATGTGNRDDAHRRQLREALRCAASALKEHGPRFALAGSYALWAYGAPEPTHDVDIVVAEADAPAAATTLAKAGFGIEHPPEDWLFKAHNGAAVVDVLHRLNGVPVAPDIMDTAKDLVVLAITMPVLRPTNVFIQKLRALDERNCNFATLLPAARAIREQLDWDHIEAQTSGNDFAAAFLTLAKRLRLPA
ncbi:hypothetical protein MB901379_04590 [Mycobacterium basiliense]|uniref:Nucleotidyltransferase n=1 Tax=Mycobacterium basiliense TaxID=2094119 RepID=A0A3S4CFD3_9MYCO|nr:nucleotidyltransferase [Mycobacterium basiliense]VDM90978.1 hypothetical protein MB901379_04590 [Mycobacterium basiliense]